MNNKTQEAFDLNAWMGNFDIVLPRPAYKQLKAALAGNKPRSEPVAWYDPTNRDPGQSVTFSKEEAEKWPHIFKEALFIADQLPSRGAPEFLAGLYRWLSKVKFERSSDEAIAAGFGAQLLEFINSSKPMTEEAPSAKTMIPSITAKDIK